MPLNLKQIGKKFQSVGHSGYERISVLPPCVGNVSTLIATSISQLKPKLAKKGTLKLRTTVPQTSVTL